MGNFLYTGTRPDDPNDLVPHEHRRELRALRVFGAWTNLTDWKAANTLDALVTVERPHGREALPAGRRLDLRPATTTCTNGTSGYEHFYQGGPTAKALLHVRFCAEPVADDRLRRVPVDRQVRRRPIRSEDVAASDPDAAYIEMRDDDAFWAARRVVAFTDDLIRAAVHTGEFSDPAAEKHLADVLIKRRDKIASVYLTAVNPVVSPRLDANNRLTFENAAVAAGVAKGAVTYRAAWALFDNATGADPTALGNAERDDDDRGAERPADGRRQLHRSEHLRRQRRRIRRGSSRSDPLPQLADGWKLVGLVRVPDVAPAPAGPGAKPTTR